MHCIILTVQTDLSLRPFSLKSKVEIMRVPIFKNCVYMCSNSIPAAFQLLITF